MHLQENTLFDLGVKVTRNVAQYPRHHVTQNVAQYPRHHVTYATAKFDFATSHS